MWIQVSRYKKGGFLTGNSDKTQLAIAWKKKKEDPDSILKHPTHRNQRKDEARSYKHRKSKIRGKNKGITMKRRIPEKVERGRNRRWDFTIDGKGMND